MPGNRNKRKHVIIPTNKSAVFNPHSQNSAKRTLLVDIPNVICLILTIVLLNVFFFGFVITIRSVPHS